MDTTSTSPPQRSTSPDPWATPSLAIGAIPPLDRSVSTASSVSSVSGRSAGSRLSDGGRRRGYMRPEGTEFSESAKSRESVMNLGTIAHLQYYFARTGLLDTATGRIAKGRKPGSRTASGNEPLSPGLDAEFGVLSPGSPMSEHHMGEGFNNPIYVPPPPDMTVLRRELRESLAESMKHLHELEKGFSDIQPDGKTAKNGGADASGWHEVQGLNLLDVTTLAIRAAKNYYTAHEEPQRLYAIKSEREIRKELYDTLEVLKRLAIRNLETVFSHTKSLNSSSGRNVKSRRRVKRGRGAMATGQAKSGSEKFSFSRSFDETSAEALPEWTAPTERTTRTQTKPYRCADNLRYWVKAAELRWDIKLDVDVMGVVQGKDAEAWRKFDAAILQWSQGVREEITLEWLKQKNQARTPTLQIDPNYEAL
ncbi:hypothetical protein J3E74DRAFT_446590 [Bipolaris maydis]|nr:hypothetical protein J3E74DRAFT_433348 [Bipolaris maydis]KAJ5047713.1 hypothetical protein J3E74DRAFT_446590 [Bipolaris maydis]